MLKKSLKKGEQHTYKFSLVLMLEQSAVSFVEH